MFNFKKKIYLDYASLTPIDRGVLNIVNKYSDSRYSNPSALYKSAIEAKQAMVDASERIAKIIHAQPDEIVFTSGGTESNNLALGTILSIGKKVLISSIEHSSILKSNLGIKSENIIRIPVNDEGVIDLDFLKENLTAEIGLVSIMMVNNEIGTIEPIHEISKIIRDANKRLGTKILFHTDACQAFASLPVYVEKLGADLISLDGHKIYGPRGMGMLYVKRNSVDISRSGTDNVPGIMGLAYAMELSEKMRTAEVARMENLKKILFDGLFKINKDIKINGSVENSVSHILNVNIPNIDNEFFVLQLDAKGIECSTKSACLTDEDESYVLKAIGANSHTSVRFSFGRGTKVGDIKTVLTVISKILLKR